MMRIKLSEYRRQGRTVFEEQIDIGNGLVCGEPTHLHEPARRPYLQRLRRRRRHLHRLRSEGVKWR